jgi:CHASE3 domain sensor protein
VNARRLTVGGWFAVLGGAATLVAVLSLVVGLLAADRLTESRERLVDRVDLAAVSALRLNTALVDEETGVRGFSLAGRESFLVPLRRGRTASRRAFAELDRLLAAERLPEVRADLARVRAATDQWRAGYAEPTVRRVRERGPGAVDAQAVTEGDARFDAVRRAADDLERGILRERELARRDLEDAATALNRALVVAGVVLLLTVLLAGLFLLWWRLIWRREKRFGRRRARGPSRVTARRRFGSRGIARR